MNTMSDHNEKYTDFTVSFGNLTMSQLFIINNPQHSFSPFDAVSRCGVAGLVETLQ